MDGFETEQNCHCSQPFLALWDNIQARDFWSSMPGGLGEGFASQTGSGQQGEDQAALQNGPISAATKGGRSGT